MEKLILTNMIYNYLCHNHKGKDLMIKNRDLRIKFGIRSDKALRGIIQDIRLDEKYSEIIGSESGTKGGYYICENKEEVDETIANQERRGNAMLESVSPLRRKREKKFGGIE